MQKKRSFVLFLVQIYLYFIKKEQDYFTLLADNLACFKEKA